MRQGRLSLAGLSVLFALGLALWEVYFFWFAGSFPSVNGMLGLFTAERLGFNLGGLAAVFLTVQLTSVPFPLASAPRRLLRGGGGRGPVAAARGRVLPGVRDPDLFGKPHLIGTEPRWEAAFLLIFITLVDLFGGYTFNIALSRRTMDVSPVGSA